MEPIEAPNLDNQYKYYWEGDLCGQAGAQRWGCLRSLLGLWGRGSQKSPVRGLTGVQDPAPCSGLGPADGMMPPEMRIRAQLGCSLGISANTKYKQNPANTRLEPGVPPTLGISGLVWKTLKTSRSLASRGARLCGRVQARLLGVPSPWPARTAVSSLVECLLLSVSRAWEHLLGPPISFLEHSEGGLLQE